MRNILFSRRALVLGALAGSASALLPRLLTAAPLDDVLASPSVDLHSHAGGRLSEKGVRYNVAQRMMRGRFGIVTIAAVSDKTVIRAQTNAPAKAFRDPKPGELYADILRQFADSMTWSHPTVLSVS